MKNDSLEMFTQMLLGNIPMDKSVMIKTLVEAMDTGKDEIFMQMLSLLEGQPNQMSEVLIEVMRLGNNKMFRQMLQSVNKLPYLNFASEGIDIIKIAKGDAEIYVGLLSKGEQNNPELIAQLKAELPAALANPGFKKKAMAAAIKFINAFYIVAETIFATSIISYIARNLHPHKANNTGRDEFHYILDETHVEIRTIAELEAAAGEARTTIQERCSGQEVEFSAYKTARNRCVRDIMEELGQNPVFNDIMDVVAVSYMVRSDISAIMEDTDIVEIKFGSKAGAYFRPIFFSAGVKSIIKNIYDLVAGNIDNLEFLSHAGNTVFSADKARDELRGTVIHEFAHFAMSTVFQNGANPYYLSAIFSEEFTGIVLQTIRNLYTYYLPDKPLNHDLTVEEMAKAIDSLIDPSLKTFSHMFLIPDTYSPRTYNLEFVVRLPEILAQFYNGDNYMLPSELQACFEPLISYWKDFITPEMRKYIDAHLKGHLVTTDRVYEENILAHSGEHYLLLEGKKTPANAALARKAQALIAAIRDNNIQEFNRIIEAVSDDRLPRIALAQVIEHNKPEIFEVAFAKIKHPQYLGSLLIKAIENGQYSMAEQIQPHIKDQYFISTAIMAFTGHEGGNELFNTLVSISQENGQSFIDLLISAERAGKSALCTKLLMLYDKDAFKLMEMLFDTRKNAGLQKLLMEKLLSMEAELVDRAISEAANINKSEYLDTFFNALKVKPESEYLSTVLQIKNLLLMEKAFADAVRVPREKMFEQMLPYMVKHPQYMEKALDIAAEHNKSEMFAQMLPYMGKHPQYMEEALDIAAEHNKSEMFAQMLPYMVKEPQYMGRAFGAAVHYGKSKRFEQMLPYMVKEPQYMERAFEITVEFDKPEMFAQMLPYMAKYPQYMKGAFNAAIYCDKFKMFEQMLPYMVKEPQYMEKAFTLAIYRDKVGVFKQLIQSVENDLPYINSELPYIGFKIESIVKIAADDAEIFVELLSKGARNNHDLVAKLKEELPAALANPAFKQQAIAAATALGNQDILSLIAASVPQPAKTGQGETLFSNLDFLPNFPGAAAASVSDMRPLPPPLSFSDLPPVIPELQSVSHPLPVAAIAPSAESQSTAMTKVSSAVTSYSGVAEAAFLTAGARYFYTTAMNIGDSMFGTPAPVKTVAKTHRLLKKQYDVMMAEIEEIRESIRPRREEIQVRLGTLERQPLLDNNGIKEKKSLTIEASVLQGISYKCIEAKFALDEAMEKMTTPQLTVRGLSKIKETLKQVKTGIAAMQKQVAESVPPKSHAEKAGKKPARNLAELKRQKPSKKDRLQAVVQDGGEDLGR